MTEQREDPRPTAQAGQADQKVPPATRTVRSVIDDWYPRLLVVRDGWEATLPPEARDDWTIGAAYVRESSAGSLVKDAPDGQLRNLLDFMAQKRIYIGPDAVFFDVESGTDIGPRLAFQRLFEQAIAGGYRAVGAFVNERMFRNLEQATRIKREFRLKGIELVYLGMYEGDRRNPAAWQLQTMQDTSAELHSRNTSFYVGMHMEQITRNGRPVGRMPEVHRELERAPSFLGRRGSVISWEIVEPLGTVMQEGCKRYLAGESMADLARWSATTVLGGLTPARRVMDKRWWYTVLTNPKFAGYQVPTTYTGFKPGIESPKRPRRTATSELVPCMLPALWSLDDYHEILRLSRKRWSGGKRRRTYRPYLLTGIAYDASCGHRMKVDQIGPDGRYWMTCKDIGVEGRHSPSRRCDIAARELDDIVGRISFDDNKLCRQIEDELMALSRKEASERDRFRPNGAIAAARQALAALKDTGMADLRSDLERRIAEMETADRTRRDEVSEPLVEYRRALATLKEWRDVWREADLWTKNRLLREAGVRVEIGSLPDETRRGPAHLLAISAEHPVFELALAVVSRDPATTLDRQHTLQRPNVAMQLHLSPDLAHAANEALSSILIDGVRHFHRATYPTPRLPHNVPPVIEGGPWVTTTEFLARTGCTYGRMRRLRAAGDLHAVSVVAGKRVWHLIHESEVSPRTIEAASLRPLRTDTVEVLDAAA